MSSDAQVWHEGFVLHTRPYSNTSLIVEVFARDTGRVSVLAKGARASRSKYYSVLQPFVPLRFRWAGRGELQTLFEAEAIAGACLPPERYFTGFYLNELLLRLLHKHDAHPDLLDSYAQTLAQLAAHSQIEPPLRYFEVRLLNEIGYGLELDFEFDSGEPVQVDALYDYRPEQGPLRVTSAAQARLAVSGDTLLALRDQNLESREQQREAKKLLRVLMAQYLGDRPLESRKLFQEGAH